MTRQEAKDLIYLRGFEVWATLGTGEFQAMDKNGINLWVNWETEKFRMAWNVPYTLINIRLEPCSAFDSDRCFQEKYNQMREVVKRYLNGC